MQLRSSVAVLKVQKEKEGKKEKRKEGRWEGTKKKRKKELELLQELPQCDIEKEVSKCCWKSGTSRFAQCRVATTFNLSKKQYL